MLLLNRAVTVTWQLMPITNGGRSALERVALPLLLYGYFQKFRSALRSGEAAEPVTALTKIQVKQGESKVQKNFAGEPLSLSPLTIRDEGKGL